MTNKTKNRKTKGKDTKTVIPRSAQVVLLVLIAVYLSSSAFALGVAPARQTVLFEPGKELTFSFVVINNAAQDTDVVLFAEGEFADRVRIDTPLVQMNASEGERQVTYHLKLPEHELTPGDHVLEIVALGRPRTSPKQGATVRSLVAVGSKLVIQVPYPDKYLEARLYVPDGKIGEPLQIALPVFNKGSLDINAVSAVVDIVGVDGLRIASLKTAQVGVQKQKMYKFELWYSGSLEEGAYIAKANVKYDDHTTALEKRFQVGDIWVDITGVSVQNFRLGEIAKFDIGIFNNWNQRLLGVYGDVRITDPHNTEYVIGKTASIDIQPKSVDSLEAYWETQNRSVGIYKMTIRVFYEYRVRERSFVVDVRPDRIIIYASDEASGRDGAKSREDTTMKNQVTGTTVAVKKDVLVPRVIFLVVLVLVLVATAILLIVRRKRKGNGFAYEQFQDAKNDNAEAVSEEAASIGEGKALEKSPNVKNSGDSQSRDNFTK